MKDLRLMDILFTLESDNVDKVKIRDEAWERMKRIIDDVLDDICLNSDIISNKDDLYDVIDDKYEKEVYMCQKDCVTNVFVHFDIFKNDELNTVLNTLISLILKNLITECITYVINNPNETMEVDEELVTMILNDRARSCDSDSSTFSINL